MTNQSVEVSQLVHVWVSLLGGGLEAIVITPFHCFWLVNPGGSCHICHIGLLFAVAAPSLFVCFVCWVDHEHRSGRVDAKPLRPVVVAWSL